MCANSNIICDLECYLDDLYESFEDFVKKSLAVISVALGTMVVVTLYALKVASDRGFGRSNTERGSTNDAISQAYQCPQCVKLLQNSLSTSTSAAKKNLQASGQITSNDKEIKEESRKGDEPRSIPQKYMSREADDSSSSPQKYKLKALDDTGSSSQKDNSNELNGTRNTFEKKIDDNDSLSSPQKDNATSPPSADHSTSFDEEVVEKIRIFHRCKPCTRTAVRKESRESVCCTGGTCSSINDLPVSRQRTKCVQTSSSCCSMCCK